jgi:hypothetical protein
MRPSRALKKYWLHVSHPFSGRNGSTQMSIRNGRVVSTWTQRGGENRISISSAKVTAGTHPKQITRKAGPWAGSAEDHRPAPEGGALPGPSRGLSSLDSAGRGIGAAELAATLRSSGLPIVAGDSFAVDRQDKASAVRISIGGVMDHDGLRRLIDQLNRLLDPRAR